MTDASLPTSVRKQLESAEALHNDNYTTPVDQFGHSDKQTEELPKEPAKPQNSGEDRDAMYWQQRFNVLQGKYNAEVPQLQQQIKALQEQLDNTANQSGKAAELAGAIEAELSEEELELLGPELTKTIRKMIAKSVPTANDDLAKLQTKVESFEQEAAQHKQALFWTEVNRSVPDWKEMQAKPEAQTWLTGIDPISGQVRNDLLQHAANIHNAYQVIKIFNEMAIATNGRKIPNEKIHPNTSRAQNNTQEAGKLWSRSEINQFYKDKTRGRYNTEQANAIERDIFAAQNDGRIVA